MKILRKTRTKRLLEKHWRKGYRECKKLYIQKINQIYREQTKIVKESIQINQLKMEAKTDILKNEIEELEAENKMIKEDYQKFKELKVRMEYISQKFANATKNLKLDVSSTFKEFAQIVDEVERVSYLHDVKKIKFKVLGNE